MPRLAAFAVPQVPLGATDISWRCPSVVPEAHEVEQWKPSQHHRTPLAALGLQACALVRTLAALRSKRLRHRVSATRLQATKTSLGSQGGGQAGKPSFELNSICGVRSEPYAHAQIDMQGMVPAGASVAAVSSAGLKGRGASVNQDCIAVTCQPDGRWIGLVVDGHGDEGHRCAERLCATLPGLVSEAMGAPELLGTADVPTALRAAFAKAEMDLEATADQQHFNITCSGGAAVGVALCQDSGIAYIMSCGDSQAVIFDVAGGSFEVNRPHKAHDNEERQRIAAAGGVVEVGRDGHELFSRVYPPSRDFGLAMSRSFGDLCVKRHGVIAEPSILELPLSKDFGCVVGSDGLFEFMPPAEIVAMLQQRWVAHGGTICAEALVAEAQRRWQKEEGNYCDDVTCLLVGVGAVAGRTSIAAGTSQDSTGLALID